MRIKGIWADAADQLPPEQWVEVWWVEGDRCEYFCSCQVGELPQMLEGEDRSSFGLKLTDAAGQVLGAKP